VGLPMFQVVAGELCGQCDDLCVVWRHNHVGVLARGPGWMWKSLRWKGLQAAARWS